jgi:endoglucanase
MALHGTFPPAGSMQVVVTPPPPVDTSTKIFLTRSPSTPSHVNEDGTTAVTFIITTQNPIVDMSCTVQMTNALTNDADWDITWINGWTAACSAVGAVYTNTGSALGKITFPSTYSGAPINFTRHFKADNRTEGTEQGDMFIANPLPSPTVTIPSTSRTASIWSNDTSTTPPGTPTLTWQRVNPTNTISEGDTLILNMIFENPTVGTDYRVRIANVGGVDAQWTEPFKVAMGRAVQAAGCQWTPLGTTNGGLIKILSTFTSNKISLQWQPLADKTTEAATMQTDFFMDQVGATNPDPNLIFYSTNASIWIADTSQVPTSSAWIIEPDLKAPTAGQTITLKLYTESGISTDPVTVTQVGTITDNDLTAPFQTTLQQACAANGKVTYGAGGVLTPSADFGGTLSFALTTKASATGKMLQVHLANPGGDSYIVVEDAVLFIGTTGYSKVAFPKYVTGVNYSGAEFGDPGAPWTYNSYQYWNQTVIDYWWGQGARIMRHPFWMERMQEQTYGPLKTTNDGVSGTADWTRMLAGIKLATDKGFYVILDPHNYGRRRVFDGTQFTAADGKKYWGPKLAWHVGEVVNGSRAFPPTAYFDFWKKVASDPAIKNNPKIVFCLMNEPELAATALNAHNNRLYQQGAINAIRSVGCWNFIMVPGNHYTGAHSWVGEGNAAEMALLYDPIDNYAFDMHQYLDQDNSGTRYGAVSGKGAVVLQAAYNWAATNKRKIFIGETAVTGDSFLDSTAPTNLDPDGNAYANSSTEMGNMLTYMSARKDVFVGWTSWGAGNMWSGSYPFRQDPSGTGAYTQVPAPVSGAWGNMKSHVEFVP